MNMLKLTAAAALVAASLSASAMSSIADEDLSAVAGQDGVSIAANLNINIGSFTWGNKADAAGQKASVSFNGIQISGLVAMTIDVISGTQFNGLYQGFTTGGTNTALGGLNTAIAANAGSSAGAALAAANVVDSTATFYNGTSDVVQFAFPNVKAKAGELLNISVNSITLGSNGVSAATDKSFGSFSISQLDMRGTSVWMWAH
ncbi:MAG: DUF6160 family protein [Burkholderiaceae bacterium]|jgi:hypothetical protein